MALQLMTTMTKKYRSYNQNELKLISDYLCDNIEHLLLVLNIKDYRLLDKMVVMACPVHGGDNQSALNLYHTGDTYRGNWKCRTHQCEQSFKSSIIGFIRGCLSNNKLNWSKPGDDTVSFSDTTAFIESLMKDKPNISIEKKHENKQSFINTVQKLKKSNNEKILGVSRKTVQKQLQIPSPYFLSRNFSANILNKYDVGECFTPGKEMNNRAVVPIYDVDSETMIGCTGRSIFEKCKLCGSFHSQSKQCPGPDEIWLYSKWKHSKNFKTQESLYNLWYAKSYIKDSKTAIIVESPGNVWKLEEAGIHNSIAIYGSSFTNKQKLLLDTIGAMHLITIMDNDTAGQQGATQIYSKCNRTYNVQNIVVPANDIAELTVSDINTIIKPQLQEYILC
jgi:5S rRNA maturation endonuclease (ribonuclease M5)